MALKLWKTIKKLNEVYPDEYYNNNSSYIIDLHQFVQLDFVILGFSIDFAWWLVELFFFLKGFFDWLLLSLQTLRQPSHWLDFLLAFGLGYLFTAARIVNQSALTSLDSLKRIRRFCNLFLHRRSFVLLWTIGLLCVLAAWRNSSIGVLQLLNLQLFGWATSHL